MLVDPGMKDPLLTKDRRYQLIQAVTFLSTLIDEGDVFHPSIL